MTNRTWRHRPAALAATAMILFALSACGDDAEKPDVEVTDSASKDAPVDDATVVYEKYWDIYVSASNSGELPPTAFEGVAEGPFIEQLRKNLGDQSESGVVRVGKPTFSDYSTAIEGPKARSVVCVDESKWGAEVDGEPIADSTSDTPDPQPYVATLERKDEAWIVTDVALDEKEKCP